MGENGDEAGKPGGPVARHGEPIGRDCALPCLAGRSRLPAACFEVAGCVLGEMKRLGAPLRVPPPRATGHSAVMGRHDMWLFGGRSKNARARNDLWRLHLVRHRTHALCVYPYGDPRSRSEVESHGCCSAA